MSTNNTFCGLKWKEHSEYHLSAMLDGSRIDYWPTKRKWRHEDELRTGDIEGYIRARAGKQRELAQSFCDLDANQQAEFIETVFDIAKKWNASGEERLQWAEIGKALSPRGRRLTVTFFRLVLGFEQWRTA